ncbi:hypothetical protein MASR2M39_10430 [Ignavibacteriales bacterium]
MIKSLLNLVHTFSRYIDIKKILCLAILLRLILFYHFGPWNEDVISTKVMTGDAIGYHNYALNLLSGEFGNETKVLPGFPIYLATIYTIFGVNPWVVMLFNIFFNVLSIYFLYKTIHLFAPIGIALLTSIWMAFDIQTIGFSLSLLSDVPAIFLLTLVFNSVVRFLLQKELKYLIAGGISLGAAVMLRPIGQYLIVIMIAIFLIKFYDNRMGFLKTATIFTTFYFVVLAPVLYYNFNQYQTLGLGTLGGHNLLNYNAKSVLLVQKKMSVKDSDEYISQRLNKLGADTVKNPFDREKLQLKVGMEIIGENKIDYLINHLNGCINFYTALSTVNLSKTLHLEKYNDKSFFWGPSNFSRIEFYLQKDGSGVLFLSIALIIWMLILYITAAFGVFRLLKDKEYFLVYSVLAIILYYTMITGVVAVARYRLPVHPFLMLLSAYGISWFFQSVDSKVVRNEDQN